MACPWLYLYPGISDLGRIPHAWHAIPSLIDMYFCCVGTLHSRHLVVCSSNGRSAGIATWATRSRARRFHLRTVWRPRRALRPSLKMEGIGQRAACPSSACNRMSTFIACDSSQRSPCRLCIFEANEDEKKVKGTKPVDSSRRIQRRVGGTVGHLSYLQ